MVGSGLKEEVGEEWVREEEDGECMEGRMED